MEALTREAEYALKNGSIKIRVKRSGMYQQITFKVRKVSEANISFTELFTERQIDTSELLRVAGEIGLPVEAPNGRAFPKGTKASDFSAIQ
ncbi:MAG: hypothetical protein ACP5K9_02660 [Candidatus Micrarchaeia archaeon]